MVWTPSGVEGVPAYHIVHFILDALEQLPITHCFAYVRPKWRQPFV
jgi:hypothetical protein